MFGGFLMKKPKVSLPKSSNPPLKYFFLKIALRGFFCLIGWVCMFVLHVCVVCLFVVVVVFDLRFLVDFFGRWEWVFVC